LGAAERESKPEQKPEVTNSEKRTKKLKKGCALLTTPPGGPKAKQPTNQEGTQF
jgi:hypothetical protein